MSSLSLKPDDQRHRAGLRQVNPAIVEVMKAVISGQTDERLTAQFGLSYNTWCKIRSCQPVRRSLAERLELRVQKLVAGRVESTGLCAANGNELPATSACRGTDIEQARFEASVARELCGDVDF